MGFNQQQIETLVQGAKRNGITPQNCPHCEYDRRFPGFERGGWLDPGNNARIVACPMCNADGAQPRQSD